jgi:hypothetical protein
MPDAFVTAPGTPARAKAAVASFAPRFLDADGKMRVVAREDFIGRGISQNRGKFPDKLNF